MRYGWLLQSASYIPPRMLENIDRSLAHKSAFAISGLIANGTIISVMKLSGLVRLTCLGDTDQLGSTTQYLQVISAASVGRAARNFCLRAKACFIVFAIRIKRGTTAVPLRYIGTLKKSHLRISVILVMSGLLPSGCTMWQMHN